MQHVLQFQLYKYVPEHVGEPLQSKLRMAVDRVQDVPALHVSDDQIFGIRKYVRGTRKRDTAPRNADSSTKLVLQIDEDFAGSCKRRFQFCIVVAKSVFQPRTSRSADWSPLRI